MSLHRARRRPHFKAEPSPMDTLLREKGPICGEPVYWAPGHSSPCTLRPGHSEGHDTDPLFFVTRA